MKKRCLLSFIGLTRSYLRCAQNIKDNIINNNKDFDFFINVNTDIDNTQSKKRENEVSISLNKEEFEYNLNILYGKSLSNISYLKIDNLHSKSGSQLFRERCLFIYDIEKENLYDIYIFIRFDVVISKPINLLDFLPSDTKMKLSFITGGYLNNNRLDHSYDWDYCWIGDKESIYKWLTYYSPITPDRNQVIESFRKINGFNGLYINDIINGAELYENWANNYWKIFYNLLVTDCEVSFDCESSDTFLKIVR
jgi:hypothetical protein